MLFFKNILFIQALNKLKLVLNELELFTRRDCQKPSRYITFNNSENKWLSVQILLNKSWINYSCEENFHAG